MLAAGTGKAVDLFRRVFIFFLLGALCPIGGCRPPPGNEPNVIIILLDTLRKDHIGLYGYDRDTTPNLDLLARDSMVFSRAVSAAPWTVPSIASLFTSLLPSIHGVNSYDWRAERAGLEIDSIPPGLQTLAEILREGGYRTGAFVANNWIGPHGGFDRGFDVYLQEGAPAPQINEQALKWIEKNRDGAFLAYIHYMDIHGPWNPPEPFASLFRTQPPVLLTEEMARAIDSQSGGYLSAGRERDGGTLSYYTDLYDGEIRYVDHHLGALLARLKELNLYEDSLIVVLSDHGEAFYEHGTFDHGYTVYSYEIDIPLVVKFPARLGLRGWSDAAAAITDVGVTILRLLGRQFPYPTSGRDLARENGDRHLWSEELSPTQKGPPKLALIEGDYKAIYCPDQSSVLELYDLDRDPGERVNLRESKPARVIAMEEIIQARRAEAKLQREKMGLKESTAVIRAQEKIEQIRSLGYLN